MTARTAAIVLAIAAGALAPAQAHAGPTWRCSAGTGWVAAGGQRVTAPAAGGEPCPVARGDAAGASGPPGSVSANGTLAVDGGTASQTTDARRPQSSIDASSLTISNADGSLVVTASKLHAQAGGSCDASRNPVFASASSPGTVSLNGRPVDSSHEYSEPGVGVNGAPLFGKVTIRFGEVAQTAGESITRRAIHVIVTDRDGTILFEGVGGEVSAGRTGPVCDPPPICPPGQEPQSGRCVDVQVAPLPPPPAPVPPLPVPPGGGPPPAASGCRDANALVGQVSISRLRKATLCLMNAARRTRRMPRLRASSDLALAATGHARAMISGRYFAHEEPAGPSLADRIIRSGYLGRFAHWRVGENLGWGWGRGGTPAAMMAAWMRSREHRRNILYRPFTDVGIAIHAGAPSRVSRRRSVTYVVDFGGLIR